MKNKTSLLLIEQALLLLVFALASAICLRAFVWADARSEDNADRDRAMIEVQNAVEIAKAVRGDWMGAAAIYGGTGSEEGWFIEYDADWEKGPKAEPFMLRVKNVDSGNALLGTAQVQMMKDGQVLLEVTAAWQEE